MKRRKDLGTQDLYIAKKIRERRIELGLSQKELAKDLNISLQQIHKYEKGIDRIFASRLYDLSRLLQVSPSFFFELQEESFPHSKELLVTCAHHYGKFTIKFLDETGIIENIKVK